MTLFIGLSGTSLAGKGVTREYIEGKYDAFGISFSDILRSELRKRDIEINRPNLLAVGNELREKYGPNVIAKRIVDNVKDRAGIALIDSIRNPAEIQELEKNLKNFVLIFIDAPIETRYERSLLRKREGGGEKTFAEFKAEDTAETSLDGPDHESNIMKCKPFAKYVIINDGSFEDLYKKIDDILASLKK